ncbi:Vacuolar protein sorting-associated protein 72 homolog (Protein YL-1) [Durusdinium trenchii]|uniref:Vacuolar protein sorting-associated protein 72 homolog (Protein YL-1) n=1 Tax=Durusdinium trenchii TaxID=1381693 RepID=A0ABP0IQX7_9DINO
MSNSPSEVRAKSGWPATARWRRRGGARRAGSAGREHERRQQRQFHELREPHEEQRVDEGGMTAQDEQVADKEEKEEEEEEEESSGTPEPYVVPQRSTRGRRMGELVGEAAEADAEFWHQDAWAELSEDDDIGSDEYSSDGTTKEKRDSDFDDVDENQEERERMQQALEQEEQDKRQARTERNKRRKGVYVDPALKVRPQKKARSTASSSRRTADVIIPNHRSKRSSTEIQSKATQSLQRQRSERARAAPKRPVEPKAVLTQQQLLEAAAQTEVENKRSLQLMMMLQEEKRREKQTTEKLAAPRVIRFSSTRNVKRDPKTGELLGPPVSSLTFTYVDKVPLAINAKASPPPEKPICSVTGLPAKYRDPVTGVPFRTVEAFKVLRATAAKPASG